MSRSSFPPPAPPAGVDPFVDALVERAAARYAGLVDETELAAMKDELRMFLIADPRASRVVDRARGRAGEGRSAKKAVPGVVEPVPAQDEDKAGGDGPR